MDGTRGSYPRGGYAAGIAFEIKCGALAPDRSNTGVHSTLGLLHGPLRRRGHRVRFRTDCSGSKRIVPQIPPRLTGGDQRRLVVR